MTLPPPLRPVSQRTAITNEGKGEGGKKYPRSPSGRSAISWVPFEEKESREKSQKSHKFNNFLGGSKDMIKQGKMKKVEHLLKLDDFTKKIQVTATSCSEFYGRQKPVCPPPPPSQVASVPSRLQKSVCRNPRSVITPHPCRSGGTTGGGKGSGTISSAANCKNNLIVVQDAHQKMQLLINLFFLEIYRLY